MSNRCKEIIIERGEGPYSTLPSISAGEYAKCQSVYTDCNGYKAVIPKGWTVPRLRRENTIWGKNRGLVIYQIPEDEVKGIRWSNKEELEKVQANYNQFVCVPVSLLQANGTIDEEDFNQQFGRRNGGITRYWKSNQGASKEIFDAQVESVQKYGVFYISRYTISQCGVGVMKSVRYREPFRSTTRTIAEGLAAIVVKGVETTSHLVFNAEYDTTGQWLIDSGTITTKKLMVDATGWGNYGEKILVTGSSNKYCANNIFDFAGNCDEWVQDVHCWTNSKRPYPILRGGYPGGSRIDAFDECVKDFEQSVHTGFRAVLCMR